MVPQMAKFQALDVLFSFMFLMFFFCLKIAFQIARDGPTEERTKTTSYRDASTHLKTLVSFLILLIQLSPVRLYGQIQEALFVIDASQVAMNYGVLWREIQSAEIRGDGAIVDFGFLQYVAQIDVSVEEGGV